MNSWMKLALEEAKTAKNHGDVPVGAVIVRGDEWIASGGNRREKEEDPTAHAEVVAIRNASKKLGSWRLEDCELYVTLEPCIMCMAAIQQARIKKVYYGASDPKAGCMTLGFKFHEDSRLNHRLSAEELPTQECSDILKEFFSDRRKQIKESKKNG